MKFIFKESKSSTELTLPVTPANFDVSHGIRIETINIHAAGDVIIGGYNTLCTVKIDCMFPAQEYPFAQNNGTDPYEYVEIFKTWCDARTVLRFVVTKTKVNIPVLINEIKYGEKDGTGDVYATIALREYREIAAVQTQKETQTGNASREESSPPAKPETYIVVSGDTLWAISRKFYGEPELCYALAKYNSIKNANLIYPGQSLDIPDKSLLKGA